MRRDFVFGSVVLCFMFFVLCFDAHGDTVYFKNGDKITGEVLSEEKGKVALKTASMGTISIERGHVDRIISKKRETEKEKKPEIIWTRQLAAGYNLSKGNSETQELSGNFLINRNRKHVDEITLKGNGYYSEAGKKMNTQKWYTMGRYAFSFGKQKKWYNFYRAEVDHDRFSDIYYRLVPATGLGYWFFDLKKIKFLLEAALGWEHTDYYGDRKNRDETVLIPRAYGEIELFEGTVLSEDLYFYSYLRNLSGYRMRSETALTCQINDKFSLRLSLVDEYDSKPIDPDIKKNDLRLISSFVASF